MYTQHVNLKNSEHAKPITTKHTRFCAKHLADRPISFEAALKLGLPASATAG